MHGAQAVALVFEHVDLDRAKHGSTAGSMPGSPTSPAARSTLSTADSAVTTPRSPNSALLAEHGPDNSALKLLDNLCMMLTGEALASPPTTASWLTIIETGLNSFLPLIEQCSTKFDLSQDL